MTVKIYGSWWILGFAMFGLAASPEAAANASKLDDFEATTIEGAKVHGVDWHGQIVVINFWATWCLPCRVEMPAFDTWYAAHRNDGVQLIAVSMDTPAKTKAVRSIASGFHFPVAMFRDAKIPGAWKPSSLPVTLVFDRAGVLRFDSRLAPGTLDVAALERITAPLIRH